MKELNHVMTFEQYSTEYEQMMNEGLFDGTKKLVEEYEKLDKTNEQVVKTFFEKSLLSKVPSNKKGAIMKAYQKATLENLISVLNEAKADSFKGDVVLDSNDKTYSTLKYRNGEAMGKAKTGVAYSAGRGTAGA